MRRVWVVADIELSPDQQRAYEVVTERIHAGESRTSLGGLAGTGKSTLLRYIVEDFGEGAAVATFTGKAASVLARKGLPQATTLHRLLYTVRAACTLCGKGKGRCKCARPLQAVRWVKRDSLDEDVRLVVVDEASMLSSDLLQDLESFNIPLLLVGDPGQLPPIGRDPGVMREPQVLLERIHRQAEGSGILQLAYSIRRGEQPQLYDGPDLRVVDGLPHYVAQADVVLCGYNFARCRINALVRELRGFKGSLPLPGERLVCLRNDYDYDPPIFNGMQATVVSATERYLEVQVDGTTEPLLLPYLPEQLGQERTLGDPPEGATLWDWGYALTVHKAQGSEWPNVVVVDHSKGRSWEPARWGYTAATRAQRHLTWCLTG
jgi:exodeoxyribonuclease-5